MRASKWIVQQLLYENANEWCKEVLRDHKKWATLSEMIQICASTGSSQMQGTALAAAMTQVTHPQPREVGVLLVSTVEPEYTLLEAVLLHL